LTEGRKPLPLPPILETIAFVGGIVLLVVGVYPQRRRQVKGKIKEIAGRVSMNPALEAEGKAEKLEEKVQEKVGQFKKVVGKQKSSF